MNESVVLEHEFPGESIRTDQVHFPWFGSKIIRRGHKCKMRRHLEKQFKGESKGKIVVEEEGVEEVEEQGKRRKMERKKEVEGHGKIRSRERKNEE